MYGNRGGFGGGPPRGGGGGGRGGFGGGGFGSTEGGGPHMAIHNEWDPACKVWVGGLGEEGTR